MQNTQVQRICQHLAASCTLCWLSVATHEACKGILSDVSGNRHRQPARQEEAEAVDQATHSRCSYLQVVWVGCVEMHAAKAKTRQRDSWRRSQPTAEFNEYESSEDGLLQEWSTDNVVHICRELEIGLARGLHVDSVRLDVCGRGNSIDTVGSTCKHTRRGQDRHEADASNKERLKRRLQRCVSDQHRLFWYEERR
eukprot:6204788-Pleurochrysis_carterae.AAC.3